MKVEEVTDKGGNRRVEDITEEEKRKRSVLFPFSKGVNRLLIVLGLALPIIPASLIEDPWWYLVSLGGEVATYLAVVWVYHGFKDS